MSNSRVKRQGVSFVAPPTPQDEEFVATAGNGEDVPSFPARESREPAYQTPEQSANVPLDEEDNEPDAFDEIARLEKFLGAKDRSDDPDTATVYVPSLGVDVVVRELNDREADDVYSMYAEYNQSVNGNRAARRAKGGKDKGLVRVSAQVVAIGLVSPDIKNPTIFAKFQQKHGEDLTVTDLLLKLIKPGDILIISDAILSLTGGGEDPVEEAKN